MAVSETTEHAALMNGVYRWQRHIYNATRKYYLLGRDRLVERLHVPTNGSVLEIGCGTGRNLILAAKRYPTAQCFGLDISDEMLVSARQSIARSNMSNRIVLAQADATDFGPTPLFGRDGFDRVFVSYSLSMIPGWQEAIRAGLAATAPGGELHIVDFGAQERLPRAFKTLLRAWLARFHVTPRDSLREMLESDSRRIGASLEFDSAFRGYAVIARIKVPAATAAP